MSSESPYQAATDPMQRLTARMPERYIDAMDAAVEEGEYPNRSEALRSAVRMMFIDDGSRVRRKLNGPDWTSKGGETS